MFTIEKRSQTPYVKNEVLFACQAPEGFEPANEPVNRRPALGYNAYI